MKAEDAELRQAAADRMQRVRDAYRAMFRRPDNDELGPQAEIVLRDLARVCNANITTATNNPHMMFVAEGRRQVWLHLQAQLKMTDEQVQMFATKAFQ